MNSPQSPQETIERYLKTDQPFALIQKERADHALLLSGPVQSLANIADIPRANANNTNEIQYDSLSIIPYAQIKERGLAAREDDATIRCMLITEQTRLSTSELLTLLPQETIEFAQAPACKTEEEEFAAGVREVIADYIKRGKVCNMVLSAEFSAIIADMSPQKVLTVFGNLLRNEFGAYMTFFYYDGLQYHIGASPERHITVDHGEVTMNPISGTYRKVNFLIDPAVFEEFLQDPKEINELFMCVDEEVKQMAQMCEAGGRIEGPFLKEMSGVVHTEYLLIGRSGKDCLDLLRISMHAPTVTGSPVEAACQGIAEIEQEPRGYYASELVLLGHHPDGTEFLGSAITIRTMRILPNGLVSLRVGTSVVRDSSDIGETKEMQAKGGGALRALTGTKAVSPGPQLPGLMTPRLQAILQARNLDMNRFLFESQFGQDRSVEELKGKTVTIIDFADQFSHVLKHMITAMGAQAEVRRFDDFDLAENQSDIVIVGPGPGDPRDEADPKMKKLSDITAGLLAQKRSFLSVCLGHQKLCEQLGMEVKAKEVPSQGMQREIDFFGQKQKFGFYNTFAGIHDGEIEGVEVCADPDTKEVFAVRGKNFSGFQFHAESIMSQNGFEILANELKRIIRK